VAPQRARVVHLEVLALLCAPVDDPRVGHLRSSACGVRVVSSSTTRLR
jgi:hypothetical protein